MASMSSHKSTPIHCSEIVLDRQVETLTDSLVAEYYNQGPDYLLDEIIGCSAVDLLMDKNKWWTMNEFPWSGDNTAGEWVCDAMQWKASQLGYPCDLAFQSGGSIRRGIRQATSPTYVQLYETYPWQDNVMVRIQMTGQEIRHHCFKMAKSPEALRLENGLRHYSGLQSYVLHITCCR
ncbi:MAG: 5'-nucleotidase C-terminal domain-containing protein [bacterium]